MARGRNGGGTGTLTVIHEGDKNYLSVRDNLTTAIGAKTVAFDRASKIVYLPTVVNDKLTVLAATPR